MMKTFWSKVFDAEYKQQLGTMLRIALPIWFVGCVLPFTYFMIVGTEELFPKPKPADCIVRPAMAPSDLQPTDALKPNIIWKARP